MGNKIFKPGDIVYLSTDKGGNYPLIVEDYCSPFIDVVYMSIDIKKHAEVRKTRLHEATIITSIPGEGDES